MSYDLVKGHIVQHPLAAEPCRPLRDLSDVDWSAWTPLERAVLLFVVRDGCILLIRKKRGLGAGKVIGPGGRIEQDETPEQCAVREVREELGVVPVGLSAPGELSFQFVDGLSIHVHVFLARDCSGEPHETGEAIPLWTPLNEIPYGEMWADDAIWLPLLLGGKRFAGRFLFDGNAMLGHEVHER